MNFTNTADNEYARLLRDNPLLPDFWRLRARIALQGRRNNDAIELLKEGITHLPGNQDLMRDLANIYLLTRDAVSARPLLENLLKSEEDHPEHIFNYARLLWLEGAYEQALEHFKEAHAHSPGDKRYALRLAQAQLSIGYVQQAMELLQVWWHKNPSAEMLALLALSEFDMRGIDSALNVVIAGMEMEPSNPIMNYLYAVLRALSGNSERDGISMEEAEYNEQIQSQWASFLFASGCGETIRFYGLNSTFLTSAIAHAPAKGLVLEFGVYHGLSLIQIARGVTGPVHGFDSFEGLPEDWKAGEPAGSYSTHGHLPQLPSQVVLHPGWFTDTVPEFVAEQTEKARFIHIDCDLYSSTRTVLEGLYPLLQTGTILVFDEYLGFPGYEQHEFRAWHEFSQQFHIGHEYIGCTLMAKKMALRITDL